MIFSTHWHAVRKACQEQSIPCPFELGEPHNLSEPNVSLIPVEGDSFIIAWYGGQKVENTLTSSNGNSYTYIHPPVKMSFIQRVFECPHAGRKSYVSAGQIPPDILADVRRGLFPGRESHDHASQ